MFATLRQITTEALARITCELGQTLAEYGLVLAIVVAGMLITLGVLGGIIAGYFDDAVAAFP